MGSVPWSGYRSRWCGDWREIKAPHLSLGFSCKAKGRATEARPKIMVGMRGLEPPRCHHHRLLRPARLPVPPHPRDVRIYERHQGVSRHCLAGVCAGASYDTSPASAPLSSEETASIEATMMTSKANPRTAPVEGTIASVMPVDKPGLSRQANSASAVARDHENRTLSNLRPTSIEATVSRIMAVYESVQLFLLPTAATTSLRGCCRRQSC